jgi:hypothetical protein
MNKVERVRVTNSVLGINDEILIRKPFSITEDNRSRYLPEVLPSPLSFCATPTDPINLSVRSGFLTHVLSTSAVESEDGSYGALLSPALLPPEETTYQHLNGLVPQENDVLLKWALLDVEARDEFDRRVSHKVICQ